MDFTTASCFTLTYGTSHYALKNRGQLKEGENLLVLGAAGGVGISAVEIGKAISTYMFCKSMDHQVLSNIPCEGCGSSLTRVTQEADGRGGN